MYISTITSNLHLLATEDMSNLTVSQDGHLIKNNDSQTSDTTEEKLQEVISETYKSYQNLHRPLWVRVETTDSGQFLGVRAEKIFERALQSNNSEPIKKEEMETHDPVTFIVGEDKFIVDKTLAKESSEVIRKMFEGSYKEKEQDSIELSDISQDAFQGFVNFIEGKELAIEDPNIAIELRMLADRLESDPLKEIALEQMRETISIDDLKDLLEAGYPKELFISFAASFSKESASELSSKIHELCTEIGTAPKSPAEKQQAILLLKRSLVSYINQNQIPMKEVAAEKTASDMILWLESVGSTLHYADFTDFPITNDDLKQLTNNSPNLYQLFIPRSEIEGDALQHIENLTNLTSLDITWCDKLEKDALQHIANLTNLTSLDITWCDKLEKDALQHIANLTNLTSLNISECRQLEKDALQHIESLENLTSLNISFCGQLEEDALKHIENLTNLTSLNISWCRQLEKDALQHIANLTNLTSLDITWCDKLEKDALQHIENLKNLTSLNITRCDQLEKDALQHIENLTSLTSLTISWCTQLEKNALQHIENLTNLTSLDITWCDKLEKDALQHIENLKNLTFLNVMGCNQLDQSLLSDEQRRRMKITGP